VNLAALRGAGERDAARSAAGLRLAVLGSRGYPSTYGGFETLVRRLAPHFVAAGATTTVYCRDEPTAWRSRTIDDVRCISTPGVERKSTSTLTYGATALADAAARGYDAVLVLNVAHGFFLPLLNARRVPTAVNVDGLEWERAKWSRAGQVTFRGGARLVARFATELVVDAEAIGDVWQREFGRRGVFIPYGADLLTPRDDARVRALGLEPGGYGLIVARLSPENNVELALDALELTGTDMPFVVVGSANYDAPIEARLRDLAATRAGFHWLGHVADQELLADLWAHCGVYVHGHSVGGTNPALLQALGAGSPTLALDTVFNREVLQRDEQLYPKDASVLAELMTAALADDIRRKEMSEHGRTVVSERYTWQGVCDAYLDLLIALAAARGSGAATQ
jgi:glycosyltransferase involved in cell wall biosynthesis